MVKFCRLLDLLIMQYPDLPRERGFAYILAGSVLVDGAMIRDPKLSVSSQSKIIIEITKYVSRGGLKLERAILDFSIDCQGAVVLDAGSSTGGFTDCLLQQGAARVYAVDVGYNQLHSRLRNDPRVVVMEKTNIKDVLPLDPIPDFAVADLSFRSIVPVLLHLFGLTREGRAIVLLKPQFEVDPREISGFNGIISDPSLHRLVLERFVAATVEMGISICHVAVSPILGGQGNREFLLDLVATDKPLPYSCRSLTLDGILDSLNLM